MHPCAPHLREKDSRKIEIYSARNGHRRRRSPTGGGLGGFPPMRQSARFKTSPREVRRCPLARSSCQDGVPPTWGRGAWASSARTLLPSGGRGRRNTVQKAVLLRFSRDRVLMRLQRRAPERSAPEPDVSSRDPNPRVATARRRDSPGNQRGRGSEP